MNSRFSTSPPGRRGGHLTLPWALVLASSAAFISQRAALLEVGYVWHASKFTREVLDGLLRIGFLHHQQIIWDKERTVLTRTHYWFQHDPVVVKDGEVSSTVC
jgi:hypothetical protein